MKPQNLPKFIFFTEDASPSEDEWRIIRGFPCALLVRNAGAVESTDNPESCHGVLGAVPEPYSHVPNAVDVVLGSLAELELTGSPVGDSDEPPTKVETPKPNVTHPWDA